MLGIVTRDNPEQAQSFVVSVYSGMRFGEQFSLTWNQVDFKRKKIRLEKTKNGSKRDVPLNAVTLEAMKQQQASVPHAAGDVVFPRPGPASDCRWWFEPALTEANITEYTWHNNRHTFCSWLGSGRSEHQGHTGFGWPRSITMAARYAHFSQRLRCRRRNGW